MKEEIQQTNLYKKNLLQRLLTTKKQLKEKKSLAKQSGFDLVQLGVVVALIGVLMAGAFVGVPAIMNNIRSNSEVSDLQTVVSNIQRVYNNAATTTGLNNQVAANLGLYPADRAVTSTPSGAVSPVSVITNRFGGEVTFSASSAAQTTTEGAGIEIKSEKYPFATCPKVISSAAASFYSVAVDGVVVKEPRKVLDITKLGAACNAGNDGVVDVTYVVLK